MINLNDLATEITEAEGGSISLGIGQVKEVMSLLFKKLASLSQEEVEEILDRYRE